MTERLVLFDIDGTILLSGGAGFRGMARAVEELYDRPFSWEGIEPGGGLDPLLLEEALIKNGIPWSPADFDAFRDRYVQLLPEELARHPERLRVMPGIPPLLEELHHRADVVLGLLTGNYGATARLKLEAAGFDWSWFKLGAFGDEAKTRPDLVALARQRFHGEFGKAIAPECVLIVGDTPKDVDCALANACQVLAVGTGSHSPAELLAAGAHVAVDDLADPSPLLEWLDGG